MQSTFATRAVLTVLLGVLLFVSPAAAQESGRKTKSRIDPIYPTAARQLDITGAVRLEVFVAADGHVKQVKVLGGHPLLTEAAVTAVSKWRYDPGPESVETVLVEFKR